MKLHIRVPATSANLGPGFDSFGLALDQWNETTITPAREFSARIEGEGAGRLTPGRFNLIFRAAQKVADLAGKRLPPFHAECVNAIPLSSGMGSSSAAILTGMLAGNALLKNPLQREEILNLACAMEGHPDNVAPALMGGLVVSATESGEIIARQIPLGMDVRITIALPDFHLSTKQARAALPNKISMKDAVHNIGRASLVAEAFRTGDFELLGRVMTDKLHQPYRLKLIPRAVTAIRAAREAGAASVAISGAGPALIAFSSEAGAGIGESMKRAFESAGFTARVFHLSASLQGATILPV